MQCADLRIVREMVSVSISVLFARTRWHMHCIVWLLLQIVIVNADSPPKDQRVESTMNQYGRGPGLTGAGAFTNLTGAVVLMKKFPTPSPSAGSVPKYSVYGKPNVNGAASSRALICSGDSSTSRPCNIICNQRHIVPIQPTRSSERHTFITSMSCSGVRPPAMGKTYGALCSAHAIATEHRDTPLPSSAATFSSAALTVFSSANCARPYRPIPPRALISASVL